MVELILYTIKESESSTKLEESICGIKGRKNVNEKAKEVKTKLLI